MNEQINKPGTLATHELNNLLCNRVANLTAFIAGLNLYRTYLQTNKIPQGYSTSPAMPTDQNVKHMLRMEDPVADMTRLACQHYKQMFTEIEDCMCEITELEVKRAPNKTNNGIAVINQPLVAKPFPKL